MTEAFGELVLRSMSDPKIFGPHFQPSESWDAWRTVIRCLYGLPLSEEELPLFRKATGRSQTFIDAVVEAVLLAGRRCGKSRLLGMSATALACFRDYTPYLAPGERAIVMVLAADRDQAQVIFQYVRALLTETPMLRGKIDRETADEILLTNRVTIGIYTSSYRAVRGRTLAAALCDEICFWRDDTSRDPASAVLQALRPALSTIPGSLLLCASSVYSRSGIAYEMFTKHWGRDASNVLVWKATTLEMNPSFRRDIIENAREQDATAAASEYDSEFRSDVSQWLADELIDAALEPHPRGARLPPVAFCDVSGGRHDSTVLAIGHAEIRDDDLPLLVLDHLHCVPAPHEPSAAVEMFARELRDYGLHVVTGDRYAGSWVSAAFEKSGIRYVSSELDKSAIYREALPLFAERRVQLLEDERLFNELRLLERRARPGGRGDSVDHPPNGHDDCANAACGALWLAARDEVPTYFDRRALLGE